MRRISSMFSAAFLASAVPASAQHEQHSPQTMHSGWNWATDGQVFLNANLQRRKFRDFYQVESQNWFMATGHRTAGAVTFMIDGMASLEPFTLRRYGSAQIFQTGELIDNAPLVNFQHPHDLVMAAGASADWRISDRTRMVFVVAPVGAPALGPPVFMHRPSARMNPTAPLNHHHLDSTHISRGVITAGVGHRAVLVEGSVFRGREPDEDRIAVEFGTLDSYAGRVSFRRGAWSGQLSSAFLKRPEINEWSDLTRTTASVGYEGTWREQPVAWLVAFGVNRGFNHREGGLLLEGSWRQSNRTTWYFRGEMARKNILTAGGLHAPGVIHPHIYSKIAAGTLGSERRILSQRWGRLGMGADLTVYAGSANLDDNYGNPVSAHFFLRWAFRE